MSVGTTDLMAKVAASAAFTSAAGNNTHGEGETITEFLSFDGNGNNIQVKDSDNETFNVSLSAIANELGMSIDTLKQELGIENLEGANAAQATGETQAAGGTKSSDEIQTEIDNLNTEKEEAMETLEALETTIKQLSEEIQDKLNKAAQEQEAKVEAYQEDVEKAIQENVQNYIAANKSENPMSKEDLQRNINSSIRGIDGIGGGTDVISDLFMISGELATLDNSLAQMKELTDKVSGIDQQISDKTSELETAKAAEEAANASQAKSCDPIGFKDASGNQFDFIVMDGAFDTTSDFLGAEGNWDAMKALDTTGESDAPDGKVDINELKAANIGLVMTNANGEQEIMNADKIAEMFGDDFTIDLNSYDKNGTYEGITDADADGNGVIDQDLQGTFKLSSSKLGEVDGYNTLDDQEWLANKYGLTADVKTADGVSESAKAVGADEVDGDADAKDLNYYTEFYATYAETAKNLREQLEQQWQIHGLNEEFIESVNKSAGLIAENKVADVKTEDEADGTEGVNETEDTDTPLNAVTGAAETGEEDKKDEEKEPEEQLA